MTTESKTNNAPAEPTGQDLELVKKLVEANQLLMDEVGKVVTGQRDALRLMLISLLCKGHCLLHGLPGLGKTLMANTLSRALDLEFCRIQFTPDLMPSDITGTDVIEEDPETGKRYHEFLQGPIFANLVLADEINRTPPKTQAALLQAMQEREISVGRKTYKLEPPFMVIATQNPIELEGTYALPEAQLDRFMFDIRIFYPTREEEIEIVKNTTAAKTPAATQVMKSDEVMQLQEIVRGVPVSDDVVNYAVRLVGATRTAANATAGTGTGTTSAADAPANDPVATYLQYGGSPRASQYLILGAKALALLDGRYHVNFADVRELAKPVLRHRLTLNFRSRADNVDADYIVDHVLGKVPEEL